MDAAAPGLAPGRLVAGTASEAVRVLRPGWEPSMAFLSRSKPARTRREATDEWAEEVKKKLDPPESGAG